MKWRSYRKKNWMDYPPCPLNSIDIAWLGKGGLLSRTKKTID